MNLVNFALFYCIVFPDELPDEVPANMKAASSENNRNEKIPKTSDGLVARRLNKDALSKRKRSWRCLVLTIYNNLMFTFDRQAPADLKKKYLAILRGCSCFSQLMSLPMQAITNFRI